MIIHAILVALFFIFITTAIWLWDIGRYKAEKLSVTPSVPVESESSVITLGKDPNESHLAYPTLTSKTIRYEGEGQLPKRVYEGDSKNITLDLKKTFALSKITDQAVVFFRNKISKTEDGLAVTVQVSQVSGEDEYLEFELIAAGFTIEGEKKQKQMLTLNDLHYQWNCYFPNSGNHTFALLVRLTNSQSTVEVGRIEHTIKVVKLDHMTQRQVWMIATLAGIISGSLALAEALHQLGLW